MRLPETVEKISSIATKDDDGASVRTALGLLRQGINPLDMGSSQLLGSFKATSTQQRAEMLPLKEVRTVSHNIP